MGRYRMMRNSLKKLGLATTVSLAVALPAAGANAAGLFDDRDYQFRDSATTAAAIAGLDMRQKMSAGVYNAQGAGSTTIIENTTSVGNLSTITQTLGAGATAALTTGQTNTKSSVGAQSTVQSSGSGELNGSSGLTTTLK
jgi:hypothetical protein